MAEPLSVDLRKRVVDAVKNWMSRRRAAAQFRVGVSSAIRWTSQADKLVLDRLAPFLSGASSAAAVDELGLKPGSAVVAVIKASDVIIATT